MVTTNTNKYGHRCQLRLSSTHILSPSLISQSAAQLRSESLVRPFSRTDAIDLPSISIRPELIQPDCDYLMDTLPGLEVSNVYIYGGICVPSLIPPSRFEIDDPFGSLSILNSYMFYLTNPNQRTQTEVRTFAWLLPGHI